MEWCTHRLRIPRDWSKPPESKRRQGKILPYRLQRQHAAAAAAKSLQSCLSLCDPIDGSPPGSAVPGILQERTLEWVAISFSNAWKWKVKGKSVSRVWLFTTPWTAAYHAPPFMGFCYSIWFWRLCPWRSCSSVCWYVAPRYRSRPEQLGSEAASAAVVAVTGGSN